MSAMEMSAMEMGRRGSKSSELGLSPGAVAKARSFVKPIYRHRIALFLFLCAFFAFLYLLHKFMFLILFFTHLPIYVPPVSTDPAAFADRPLLPLYVLSASEERWARYQPPHGVTVTRVKQTAEIADMYIKAYTHPHWVRDIGSKRCATGHLWMWDTIARDPRCARARGSGGCMVTEDDARVAGGVDPRPYIETWKALGPDFVTFYKLPWEPWSKFNTARDTLLALVGLPREDVEYVTFGWGGVAYVLTSEGANQLLEPLRSGAVQLRADIDSYIFDQRWNHNYRHGVSTYVERRYPIIHDDHGKTLRSPWGSSPN